MKPQLALYYLLSIAAVSGPLEGFAAQEVKRPNVVILLADDMGYGEIQHLNPERGKIKTPHLDALARSGMVFTDAHSSSSVCTPTRYGLITGRYAWRTRLQSGVLRGGTSLIAQDRLTLAKMLKAKGYDTAMIGKWHLGMLFDGKKIEKPVVPVGAKVTHGPLDRGGFDEFVGFHHAGQIKVLAQNDQVIERISPIDMLPRLTREAVAYLDRRKGKRKPFFLYIPWSSPHSPVVPSKQWKGKSGLNKHADFVMQTDDSCGQVFEALRRNGLLENTIILSSSDNGTSAGTAQAAKLIEKGHYPSADLRGFKADTWDGGHRVPFLVSWPGIVQAGSVCNDLVCLNDLMATLAELLNFELPPDSAEDSFSFYSRMKQQGKPVRNEAVHHSIRGHFAIRKGPWKLMLCPGSGGWTRPKPTTENWDRAEKLGLPLVQLYNMRSDRSEQKNLAANMPEKVQELRTLLEALVNKGRSNPGPKQANDVPIRLIKDPRHKSRKTG